MLRFVTMEILFYFPLVTRSSNCQIFIRSPANGSVFAYEHAASVAADVELSLGEGAKSVAMQQHPEDFLLCIDWSEGTRTGTSACVGIDSSAGSAELPNLAPYGCLERPKDAPRSEHIFTAAVRRRDEEFLAPSSTAALCERRTTYALEKKAPTPTSSPEIGNSKGKSPSDLSLIHI